MVRAADVNPQKWENIIILFENKYYSVISGEYEGEHALGERWNGEGNNIGFPNLGANPLWHVIPDFLSIPVLFGLVQEFRRNPYEGSDQHLDSVIREIRRFCLR